MPPGDDYAALLSKLYSARRFGMRLELGRIASCLDRLGNPQLRFRARVQIGGTNGKGSTAAFLESMLRHAGVRTGLFTSPHLSRFEERFRVNGKPLATSVIAEAGRVVDRAAKDAELAEPMTFFEHATAMAVWAFACAEVEVAVMEVGLGGRFDATTAVGADVAAVTGVAFDHEQILGATLREIAGEKTGIFRAGQRVVVGASGEPQAVEHLTRAAVDVGVADLAIVEAAEDYLPADWRLGLAGAHQRANAACAVAVLEQLEALGLASVDRATREIGLARTALPGRLESVTPPGEGRVLLDGAHNPHAALALSHALAGIERRRLIAVLGVSRGKDASGIAGPLVAAADEVVVTQSRQDRAMPAVALARVVRGLRRGLDVSLATSTAAALRRARERAGAGDLVVVAGSLFVVGEAREHLCGIVPDPIGLSDPAQRGAPTRRSSDCGSG